MKKPDARQRIVVFSLNPSVDVEWSVPRVVWEEKNNILSERRWAGGKGVNVARWLRLLGAPMQLVLPLGGNTGKEMEDFLASEGLSHKTFWIRHSTRANIIVTTAERRQLRFNPLGPELDRLDWEAIFRFAADTPACMAICSGALPRNAPRNAYQNLGRIFASRGIPCVLDCDGVPFAEGIRSLPLLVKPNRFELAQWVGKELETEDDVIVAAKELAVQTTKHVLVSMGAEGALLVWNQPDEPVPSYILRASSPEVTVLNTIGAGDSMLAGAAFALAEGKSPEDCLRLAIAVSTAAVSKPAGVLPKRMEIEKIVDCVKVWKV